MVTEHWCDKDHELLSACDTFEKLAEKGIQLLYRVYEGAKRGTVAFIAGPMTTGGIGGFKQNLQLHEHTIAVAREQRLTVFNQIPFQNHMIRIGKLGSKLKFEVTDTDYPLAIITDFYYPLFESKLISDFLLLPGYQSSRGAMLELHKAVEVERISIRGYPKAWYTEALSRYQKLAAHEAAVQG
jgi:hypothetical protein